MWEESRAGGIPCRRNPVGRDPVVRGPVREESRAGGVPWGGVLWGGIPWEESRLGGIPWPPVVTVQLVGGIQSLHGGEGRHTLLLLELTGYTQIPL